MKKYICFAFLLSIAYVAKCHDIPLDISLKVPNSIYAIEEVKLLGNAREYFFRAALDDDKFHPITNKGVPIDPDLTVITNLVELLRTPQKVFLRMNVLDRITEDGKIIMSYICYCYENGKWVLSNSRSYMEHKLQYMKKISVTIPFTENDDIKLVEYRNLIGCIAKNEYAVIDEVTHNGTVVWSSADANGNRIIQLAYKNNTGFRTFTAVMADPNNNACLMTFLIIANKVWPSYYNIDEVSPEFQQIVTTADAHYLTQRKVSLIGNIPFTPTSPFDVVDTLPEGMQGLSNNSQMTRAARLGNIINNPNALRTVNVDLASVDVEKSHCSRIYHFGAPGSPYSLTSDEGYAFGKLEWYSTVVFHGLKNPPFYIVYYGSISMQTLYTFSLNGDNIERIEWKHASDYYNDEEAQWEGTVVRAENFYPPPLTLDISKPFDSRFYEIIHMHYYEPSAAYVTPRKEFKLKAIVDGDVTIHVFKRAQWPTIAINTFLPGYIHIMNPRATSENDKYIIYRKGNDNRWVQADESDIFYNLGTTDDRSLERAESI